MESKSKLLRGHPIFNPSSSLNLPFDLSLRNLSQFKSSRDGTGTIDSASTSYGTGRRKIMALRESDIILAVRNEIRIASLTDARTVGLQRQSYKESTSCHKARVLHTPNLEFDIHQITVNSNGKLLAVAGSHQVAVVSLPRAGYSKLVTAKLDCKTIQIGQFHHATTSAAPICKIEWHPWGRGACTLLVMTTDGTFREYDVSADSEEPQQSLLFFPERTGSSSYKGDISRRYVTSFCLGKGKADWGPLTVYALTKSGDIWAMCPFLPSNATMPSAYIHALEYFVRAKEELAATSEQQQSEYPTYPRSKRSLSTFYAHQLKYALSLSKQLPDASSTLFPAQSRLVSIKAPSIVKARPARQGPFLFQPAPKELENGEGGDATDLAYMSVEGSSSLHSRDDDDGERLGVLKIAYSDGKVDVCLDLEKVEAVWESNQVSSSTPSFSSELPMMAVYETIDLGLVSMLSEVNAFEPSSWLDDQKGSKALLDILQANYPVFTLDPIYEDTVYIYHAFGVHCLDMSKWLRPLTSTLRGGLDDQLGNLIKKPVGSVVTLMLDTFVPELRSSRPVVSVNLPSDVYISYSLFALTTSLDIHTFELVLHVDPTDTTSKASQSSEYQPPLPSSVMESVPSVEANDHSLVSLLSKEPYQPPPVVSPDANSALRTLSPKTGLPTHRESIITPETLRDFANIAQKFQSHIRDLHIGLRDLQDRLMLQDTEFQRQQAKYVEIMAFSDRLEGPEQERITQRFELMTTEQKQLLTKFDNFLRELKSTSSPELNEHEKRWFAELQRMKADVLGEDNYDSGSLKARTNTLTHKFEYYMPSLQELAKVEEWRRQDTTRNPISLGHGQAIRLMMRLGENKRMLSDSVRRIEQLAEKMNIALEDHPKFD